MSNKSRLREITTVLRKYDIAKGQTPEKVRKMFEELGPTFIKLGQIMSMRSDIFPREYCEEMRLLRSEVTPMPYQQVIEVIENSYTRKQDSVFSSFEAEPIGSASIAQVHRAVLKNGKKVVVKVQRQGIYDTMEKDIALLHRAVRFIPPLAIKGLIDLDQVLEELWTSAKEEMNFLKEASNMEEFARLNKKVAFVDCPNLYPEYTTDKVLVMEYIDGYSVEEKKTLLEAGYDLHEIAEKLADNYVKQIMEDGFFHADPHPGNLRIREGKIVWIDMGMMGRLSESDKRLIGKAVDGIGRNNISEVVEVILALGEFHEKPDRSRLYADVEALLARYGMMDMGDIDIAAMMMELIEIMNANKITMPSALTMLARGMTTIEGVLADLSPQINIVQVASARMTSVFLQNLDFKKELKKEGRLWYRSIHKALDVPVLMADLLRSYRNNETRIKLDLHATDDLRDMLNTLIQRLVTGLLIASLLIGSSILCTTDMKPKLLGIPAIGAIGYVLAFILTIYMVIRHLQEKQKK
ncbi:MAG: AarF/UbiB family protein [Lachnospiraceae bacterium]|nr:AarF/UbiB family protein [Lachnospiraceae bacterium]